MANISWRELCLTSLFVLGSTWHASAADPPTPTLSSDFPLTVADPPAGLTPAEEQPWFDTFSWQEFIALNWMAESGRRGTPLKPNDVAAFKAAFAPNAAGDYPQVVWGSWKQAYELFEQGSVRPTPWDSFDAVLPCANPLTAPPKTFLDATNLDINQSFERPLIDQSKNYARYEIRINEPEYTLIRGVDGSEASWLYILDNLVAAQPVSLSMSTAATLGSVEVKGAWKPLMPTDDAKRYYVVDALVLLDPTTKVAKYQKMALVGFHVAHKVSPFKEWVWSTFEHVDNVAAPNGVVPSFNNGTPTPATPNGFDAKPPLFTGTFSATPAPVQVTRVNPIFVTPPMFSTVDLNVAFQSLLAGTIWQNYQLVSTQWPTKPANFKLPGSTAPNNGKYPDDSGAPFPTDRVANTVIETYDQGATALATGNSCMSCHYLTARSDFSWVLQDRSHRKVAPSDQARFLAAGRFVRNRALSAIANLPATEAEKAEPMRHALELLNARQASSANGDE